MAISDDAPPDATPAPKAGPEPAPKAGPEPAPKAGPEPAASAGRADDEIAADAAATAAEAPFDPAGPEGPMADGAMADGGDGQDADAAETPEDRAIEAFLERLRAEPLWSVPLIEVAVDAAMSFGALHQRFGDAGGLLLAFADRIARRTLDVDPSDYAGQPVRDRLFDLIMRHLDVLAPYREALRRQRPVVLRDPALLLRLQGSLDRNLSGVLQAAGVSAHGVMGAARRLALGVAYLQILRVWLEDETPGLEPTMAAVDRALDRLASLARSLPFGLGREPQAAFGQAGEATVDTGGQGGEALTVGEPGGRPWSDVPLG